jgi:hypothetical protein
LEMGVSWSFCPTDFKLQSSWSQGHQCSALLLIWLKSMWNKKRFYLEY